MIAEECLDPCLLLFFATCPHRGRGEVVEIFIHVVNKCPLQSFTKQRVNNKKNYFHLVSSANINFLVSSDKFLLDLFPSKSNIRNFIPF